MLVFNNIMNKNLRVNKQTAITQRSVLRSRRKKTVKITKNNKEFLRALGFKI